MRFARRKNLTSGKDLSSYEMATSHALNLTSAHEMTLSKVLSDNDHSRWLSTKCATSVANHQSCCKVVMEYSAIMLNKTETSYFCNNSFVNRHRQDATKRYSAIDSMHKLATSGTSFHHCTGSKQLSFVNNIYCNS